MVKVLVEHGWLEGSECLNKVDSEKYFSFKGIPYAKPPVGQLRFKAPQPLEPWAGLRSAKQHGPICHQFDMFFNKIDAGQEDCLYLNVYSPDLKSKKPVMVWIHGGAFMSGHGDSSFYGPDFIIRNDVVLVTFNYRLEVLGFLSLENEKVPGNAGMKDQVAVLRWVKRNIHNFGGDPDNVTIFGESAGSASVQFHMLSPMSRGLFHKAIMQSGSVTCDWACVLEARKRAFVLGRKLGLETNDPDELLDFLMKQPLDNLIKVQLPITAEEAAIPTVMLYLTPTVENKYENEEAFLTKTPEEYLKAGDIADIPIIIGHTADDGLIALRRLNETIDAFNTCPEFLLPLKFSWTFNFKEMFRLAERVRQFYFQGKVIDKGSFQQIQRLSTTIHFKYHDYRFLKYFQKNCSSKVYNYRLSAKTERNVMSKTFQVPRQNVTCHADDLMYLFDTEEKFKVPFDKTSKASKTIKDMCKLWTNFARDSNPTPNNEQGIIWKPYTKNIRNILDIGYDLVLTLCDDTEEIEFWHEMFSFYDTRTFFQTT